jgi:hypothetical protein
MPGLVHFLRCIGRAAVKNGGKALASLIPFGEMAYEIARDAYEEYRRDHGEEQLRAELEELARAHPAEVHRIAQEIAADQPPEVSLALVSYLDQLPTGLPLALSPPATLTVSSPKRTYTLQAPHGVGDVADVHLASAGECRYLVKVSRLPEGRAPLNNERKVLAYLQTRAGNTTYRHYLPTLVESFPSDGGQKRVNVFLHEPGLYTLEQVHEQHPALDGRHLAWIFKRLLTALGFCHSQGTLHGAILPCHVMIHAANHGLQFVGWGQSVEIEKPIKVLSPPYRDWYPPEVLKRQPVSPATDLYLAARCLIYLAGGGPGDRMPDSVPAPMQRFVRSCLLEGPRMRPDDAWKLHDEFDEVLRRLYGPPKFFDLNMT